MVFFSYLCLRWPQHTFFLCMQISYFKVSNHSVKGKFLKHAKHFAGVEDEALLAGVTPVALLFPRGFLIPCRAFSSR